MKNKKITTRQILATLVLLWLLIPAICLAGPTDPPAPAVPPAGQAPGPAAPAAPGNTVTENELFPQFQYKDTTADYKTDDFSTTKLGAVNALPKKDWQSTLTGIIKLLLNISGGLALMSFTAGGVMMVISQGNGDLLSKGQKVVYYSVAGLVIIAVSYAVVIGVSELSFFTQGAGGGGTTTSGTAPAAAPPAPAGPGSSNTK